MKNYSFFSFLLIISFSLKANIKDVLLNDVQFKSIVLFNDTISKLDSSTLNYFWTKDKELVKIPFKDFIKIVQLLKPINSKVYKDSIQFFLVCKNIAKDLSSKIISNISSESAGEKFNVVNDLKEEKGIYFESNLNLYFQKQIFDFYYNNNVMSFLKNEEYIKLLKPQPVFKLLKDTKTEELLNDEILFIAKNSNYKI